MRGLGEAVGGWALGWVGGSGGLWCFGNGWPFQQRTGADGPYGCSHSPRTLHWWALKLFGQLPLLRRPVEREDVIGSSGGAPGCTNRQVRVPPRELRHVMAHSEKSTYLQQVYLLLANVLRFSSVRQSSRPHHTEPLLPRPAPACATTLGPPGTSMLHNGGRFSELPCLPERIDRSPSTPYPSLFCARSMSECYTDQLVGRQK